MHNHIYKLPPPPFPPRPGTNPPPGGMYGGYAPPPQPGMYNPTAPAIPPGTATGVTANTYHGQAPPMTYAPQQPLYNQPLGFGTAAQQSAGYNSYGVGAGGISSPQLGSSTQGNAWGVLPPPTPGQAIAQWQATPYGQQQNQYTSPPPVSYTPGGSSAYQPPPAQGYQQQQQGGFQNYIPHLNGPHATGKPAPAPPQPPPPPAPQQNTQIPAQSGYGGYDGYNNTAATTAGSGWQGDGNASTGWGGNQQQQQPQIYGEGTGGGWGSNQQQPQAYDTGAGSNYTGGWQAQQPQQQVFSPVSSVGTGLSQYADTSTGFTPASSNGTAPAQTLNTSSTFTQYHQPQPQSISQPPTFTATDYNNLQHQAHSHTQNQIQSPTIDTNPSPWQSANTSQPSSIGPASGQALQKTWTNYSAGQQPQQAQQSQQQQFDSSASNSGGYGQNPGVGDNNNSSTGLGIARVDTWEQQEKYNTQQQALQQKYTHPQQFQNQPSSQPTGTSSDWGQQQQQQQTHQPQQQQPPQPPGSITPAISSSMFSGGGGFSNWEHFGMGVEEVDDEAILAERARKREEEKQKEVEEAKNKIAELPPVNVTTPTAPTNPQQPQQLQSQQSWSSQGQITASPPQSPGFPPHSILQQFHRPPSRPTTQSPGVLGFGGVPRKPTIPAPAVPGGSGGGSYWPEIGNTRVERLGNKFEPQPQRVEVQQWPEPPAEEVAKWKKQEELQRKQVSPPSSIVATPPSQQTPISQWASQDVAGTQASAPVPPKIEEVLPALSQYVHRPDGLQQKQVSPNSTPATSLIHPTIVSAPAIPTPPPPPPKPVVVSAAVQTDPVRSPTPPPPPPPPEFNVPPSLDEWYKTSIHRYIAMVLAESTAKSDKDKLQVFTDFMMDETTKRGAKYSGAVGEEEKLARVERRGTFWGDGDYRHLYGGVNRPGKEGGVELDEYLSSDDEASEDGGGALGGIEVELERELGILGSKDVEKESEEEVKPLFAGKGKKAGDVASKIEKEKPHLGEGMVQKAKEIQRKHTPLSLQEEAPKKEVLTQEPAHQAVSEPIIAPLSPRKESVISYIPPLSPATKQPKFTPSPISPPTKPHRRTDSFDTPPTPGVSQYKPFRPSTPTGKLPLDISSPSPGVSAYQAYHPPTNKTSPKVALAKPTEGYRAYRPPSGSIDAGKRTSWAGAGPSIPIARPVSTIGVPHAAPDRFHPPDRRMTMTTAPSLITAGPGIVSGVGPKSAMTPSTGLGEFQPPKRTHTMAWDTAGDVVPQAHPGPSAAKPIGGFFAIPGLDTAPERGRQIERGKTPLPYPIDDVLGAPPMGYQPPRAMSPGFQRAVSPAALEQARSRANSHSPLPQNRSRASSQAPLPAPLQTRSRASSQAPLPTVLQTRSRANSQAPPYPSKSLTPQPQAQGPFRKPDSPAPAAPPIAPPAHVPSPALAASQPAAAAVLAALNTASGRRTVTPTQQQLYTPPILPNSPPQRATLSPAPPAAQKYGAPDSPRLGTVSPRQQHGMYQPPPPRAISPGIPLNAAPTPPPIQQSIVQPPRALSPVAPAQVKPSTPVQQQLTQPPPVQSPMQQPPQPSTPPAATVPAPQSPPNPALSNVIGNLRSLLPSQIPDDNEHLLRINNILGSLPPDFSYIAVITKEYNALAAQSRAKAEDARRIRQEAHDKAVDSAYTAKDIGYGDLATLDEEFKETEAKQKQEEDTEEYDLYAKEVFGKLYGRLQDEINVLLGGWGWLVNVGIKEAAAGRAVWEVDNESIGKGARRAKPNLIEVLTATLKFYHAIEARYAKITEAIVERDRRYKKMVCGRLYENGEVKKMKEQEKHFEKQEKEALHSAATERKARTLEMWAKVEAAMMNGLEEDLSYTESLTLAVKALLAEIPATDAELSASRPKEFINDAVAELDRAYRVLDELSGRSLRLFEIYYEGGMESAKADFEEKVSKGKASGAVRKEEMDGWEKEKKTEEDRMGQELHERKGMVGGEWNGLRENILKGVGRLRGVLAGPEKKDELPKKEEQSAVKQQPQKGVWGWFK